MFLANHLSCSSTKASGRLSPFKPCGHCCHELLITATATPFSPPFGDSGRQGREVEPLWRASPTTLPAAQGHSLSPLVKDTALILTRRAGQECSAVTQSDFGRSVVSPPLSGRVPCPWAYFFLTATATAGCSCPWREYAADAVECLSCFKG